MHEESRTVQTALGKYVNVVGTNRYGEQGKPLKPMFPYEREEYDNLDEAETAADKRSHDFGDVLDASLERHEEANTLLGKRLRREPD